MASHVTTPRFSLAFSKQYLEGVENKEKSAKGLQNDAPKKKVTKCHQNCKGSGFLSEGTTRKQ